MKLQHDLRTIRRPAKPQTADDDALIRRAKEGDAEAFDELFRRYSELAYGYAYKFCKDPEQASDIVSVVFTKVYRGLWRFEGTCSFSSWLYRIVMNTYLDLKRKDELLSTESLPDEPRVGGKDFEAFMSAQTIDPQVHAEEAELLTTIGEAVSSMSGLHRDSVVKFYVESMSYEQMVQACSVPMGTVKSRMSRANHELRRVLEERGVAILA